MRIDFYHVDLLKNDDKVKKIKSIDAECSTSTSYNYDAKNSKFTKDNFNFTKDYLDIKNLLDIDREALTDDADEFLSEKDLSNLKKSISSNDYKINSKALSMSLIKYIERK